jgi:hypothetical protein
MLGLLLGATACQKAPSEVPEEFPPLPWSVHRAASEMALDGFQSGKKRLAWPYDAGAKTSADYLQLLLREGYLSTDESLRWAEVTVANLSDADPGETAFLKAKQPDGHTFLIVKDGTGHLFDSHASPDSFPPPPPRTPAWLP